MRYIILSTITILGFLNISPFFAQQNKGELSNLVCFVRFADEDEDIFSKEAEYYQNLFNAEDESSVSVYNYFQQASYKQLKWKSIMYPIANNSNLLSYKAQHNRGYYLHYSSINPEGYDDENAAIALLREQNLIKEITDYISSTISDEVNLDANNDGFVDNLCIVLSGNSEISPRYMFWPHRSALYLKQGQIRDKKVNEYILLFDGANGWSSTSPIPLNGGVICHEMSHTLGTRDLYHAEKGLNPVGIWDLMSDNQLIPQGMSAYTKYKYCKWIDEIPEISAPGIYTLNPVGGSNKENIAYKIKPIGSDEYFILEYRKKDGPFEKNLPSSGLLIYRIDPRFIGNVDYNGTTKLDEQYLFRPGGTTTSEGNISNAAFSLESGRTAFGGDASLKPFYSDGKEANLAITNISSSGETISFELLPQAPQIYIPKNEIALDGNLGSEANIEVYAINTDWIIRDFPDWLDISPSKGNEGNSSLTISTKKENIESTLREYDLVFESSNNKEFSRSLKIYQKSSIIQSPHNLIAEQEQDYINLTWSKPHEGTPVLSENFEDSKTQSNWTIKTENNVGWVWQQGGRYTLPHSGEYSMRLNSEMQDRHQDEWFISPAFSNGRILSFYSNSLAPGKNNAHNFYFVKVSKDGGKTWSNVYDLKTESSVVNKYEHIEIDLSDYISEDMRIAFQAYDDNNFGLSYWWHIDDITIYPYITNSIVKHYNIYRNGEKIGESADISFVDTNPINGNNIYAVSAVGDFGETLISNEFIIDFTHSRIDYDNTEKVDIKIGKSAINISHENLMEGVYLYNLYGTIVYKNLIKNQYYTISTSDLPKGVYIVKILNGHQKFESHKILID